MVFGFGSSSVDKQVMDQVEQVIQTNNVVIFSKSYCPYCDRTKALFRSKFSDANAHIIELDQVKGGSKMQAALQKKTGQRTVPSVFISGVHVGGNDDTYEAYHSGRLQKLLDGIE